MQGNPDYFNLIISYILEDAVFPRAEEFNGLWTWPKKKRKKKKENSAVALYPATKQ